MAAFSWPVTAIAMNKLSMVAQARAIERGHRKPGNGAQMTIATLVNAVV